MTPKKISEEQKKGLEIIEKACKDCGWYNDCPMGYDCPPKVLLKLFILDDEGEDD